MTVPAYSIAGPYTGSGTTGPFAFNFKIFAEGDLEVTKTTIASGIETILTLTTDYTVSGVGASSGSITTVASVAATHKITIRRKMTFTQTTDLRNQGGFFPEVHERVFDRIEMKLQELREELGRAVKVDISSGTDPDDLLDTITSSAAQAASSASSAALSASSATSSANAAASSASSAASSASAAAASVGAVRISANDTTPGVLNGKLVAGSGVTLTENNDGGNETLTVSASASFPLPSNLALAATVAANALTIALKGWDGTDPSASNPVGIPFRSATATTGTLTQRTITAATSLVVPSTATLGFTNGVAAKAWVVGFDDAGTFRLGIVKTADGTDIMALRDDILASSTLLDTGSDSAQVIYTGSAVTAKAMRILGYVEWSSGLAAAGTWDVAPTKIQLYHPGVPLPGEVVQRQAVTKTDTFTTTSGSYTDVTGLTVNITRTSAANFNLVKMIAQISAASGSGGAHIELMRDSAALHIGDAGSNRVRATGTIGVDSNGHATDLQIGVSAQVLDFPGNTLLSTYKAQARRGAAGTFSLNANGDDAKDTADEGRTASSIHVEEIAS